MQSLMYLADVPLLEFSVALNTLTRAISGSSTFVVASSKHLQQSSRLEKIAKRQLINNALLF